MGGKHLSLLLSNYSLTSLNSSATLAIVDKTTECVLVLCPKKLEDPSWDDVTAACGDKLEELRPTGYYPNPQPGDPHQKSTKPRKPSKIRKTTKSGRKPKVKDPEMRGVFNSLSFGISTDGGQVVSTLLLVYG